MKAVLLVALLVLLAGCNTASHQRAVALGPVEARALAQELANEKAMVLYHCQPFHNGPEARREKKRWIWSDRQGHGQMDIEATVSFALDGSARSVEVLLLDNRRLLSLPGPAR